MAKKLCWICDDPKESSKTIDVTLYTVEELRCMLGFKMCDAHQEQIEGAIVLFGGEPERLTVLPEVESDLKGEKND